ncbi:MAG TPA: acyltransferase family protein [Acidimicrobiales bacterium]|nr:acyltransferase family protein [Acidimicrobiales bacterium]
MAARVSPDAPRKGATLAYLPSLDGIRGVAMLGIMGVHGGVYLTSGGFFFLDAFFALSGFLITSLLIVEWRKRGTIKLGAFWARRARRLLPALFVMLIGVSILYGVFVPAGTYPTLRGDSLSALFYFANWHYIASGSDYFHMTGLTSPLIHTWSLAVEEQFYLVWPLVFLGVLKLTRSLWVLVAVAVTGVIASATEMALLYNPTDINRLYFGTDTHAQSVLTGATLALGLRLWAERRRKGAEQDWQARTQWARVVLTVVGVVGLAVSTALYVDVRSGDAFAYHGGFLIAALAACAVLLSVSCAQYSPVARLLSFRPFTFIGRISYGMYLWHFPLFTFINEQRTGLSPWPLYVVRVIPTIGIAILSFFLVERPIRQGTFFTRFRAQVFTLPAVGVVILAIVLATMPAADTIALGAAATGAVPATAITASVPVAYSTSPTRVLLVGDSQALTLGIGLDAALKVDPKKYDALHLLNEGILGCGVADGTTGEQSGGTFLVGAPCTPDPQSARCPPGGVFGPRQNVPCQAWAAAWTDWVTQLRPNVVVLLAGGGEVLDRLYRGHMTNILNPTFAAYVESQLEKAVRIATARGALMVLMTKPCQSTGEQPDGAPWPQDSTARLDAYNAMLDTVAAQHPGQVYVQDLNSYVCPGGTYTEDIDGVPVRQSDGSHFDVQPGGGGDYLAPAILPYWVDLGHLQEARTNGASVPSGTLPRYFAPQ